MTQRELVEMWMRQTDDEAAAGAPAPVPAVVFLPAQRSRVGAVDDIDA